MQISSQAATQWCTQYSNLLPIAIKHLDNVVNKETFIYVPSGPWNVKTSARWERLKLQGAEGNLKLCTLLFCAKRKKKNTQLFLITFGIRRNFEHHCGNNARINARCALEPNRVLYCIGKKFNKVCAIQMGF